jgi:hypothetical protein
MILYVALDCSFSLDGTATMYREVADWKCWLTTRHLLALLWAVWLADPLE